MQNVSCRKHYARERPPQTSNIHTVHNGTARVVALMHCAHKHTFNGSIYLQLHHYARRRPLSQWRRARSSVAHSPASYSDSQAFTRKYPPLIADPTHGLNDFEVGRTSTAPNTLRSPIPIHKRARRSRCSHTPNIHTTYYTRAHKNNTDNNPDGNQNCPFRRTRRAQETNHW